MPHGNPNRAVDLPALVQPPVPAAPVAGQIVQVPQEDSTPTTTNHRDMPPVTASIFELDALLRQNFARLIAAVTHGKGGVGATTIACLLAATIAEVTRQGTVVIDTNQFGTAAERLGFGAAYSAKPLGSLYKAMPDITSPSVFAEAMPKTGNGVQSVAADPLFTTVMQLDGSHYDHLLQWIHLQVPIVIEDTSCTLFESVTRSAIAKSRRTMFVVDYEDSTSLRHCKRTLDSLHMNGVIKTPTQIIVVVNKVPRRQLNRTNWTPQLLPFETTVIEVPFDKNLTGDAPVYPQLPSAHTQQAIRRLALAISQ